MWILEVWSTNVHLSMSEIADRAFELSKTQCDLQSHCTSITKYANCCDSQESHGWFIEREWLCEWKGVLFSYLQSFTQAIHVNRPISLPFQFSHTSTDPVSSSTSLQINLANFHSPKCYWPVWGNYMASQMFVNIREVHHINLVLCFLFNFFFMF